MTAYTHDAFNNVLTVEDDLGNLTTFDYDVKGNLTATTDASRQAVGVPEAGIDCGPAGTGNASDEDLDLIPDDGCPSLIRDYDAAGRLETVTDALGYVVSYEYDANGNRETMTNQRGKITQYEYDEANRLKKIIDPLLRETIFTYDAASRLDTRRDGNNAASGALTDYGYDEVDRLTSIDYPNGTADVAFEYDELGNRKKMTDGTGVTTYDYDELYRRKSVTDGANQEVAYEYDAAGLLREITYPGGVDTVFYTYDAANRLAGC